MDYFSNLNIYSYVKNVNFKNYSISENKKFMLESSVFCCMWNVERVKYFIFCLTNDIFVLYWKCKYNIFEIKSIKEKECLGFRKFCFAGPSGTSTWMQVWHQGDKSPEGRFHFEAYFRVLFFSQNQESEAGKVDLFLLLWRYFCEKNLCWQDKRYLQKFCR